MFSFFSKKNNSPNDSPEDTQPPVPASEDDFILVNPAKGDQPASHSMYPSINPQGSALPYPSGYGQGPAAAPPVPKKEVNFLQGVPFSLSKELANGDRDMASIQASEVMAYITSKMHMESLDYDFAVEKSVLLENC